MVWYDWMVQKMLVSIFDIVIVLLCVRRPAVRHTRRRPNDVVSKHHKRAVALWMLLIFGILACEFTAVFDAMVVPVAHWCTRRSSVCSPTYSLLVG